MSWSSGIHPEVRWAFELLVREMSRIDPSTRVTSARRSTAEQARLYRRWQSGQMPGPVAPPGLSLHELGLAIDVIAHEETLAAAGRAWQAIGGGWGGSWSGEKYDPIHFEVRPRR